MTNLWKSSFIVVVWLLAIPASAQPVHQEWVRYRPGHYYVGTRALDVDAEGNVYVVGYLDLDYLTIKYSPDGDLLWEARYGRGGDIWDRASAIAVDNAGNVVVSGHSYDFNEQFGSYVTVKYSTDGDELWVATFDDLDSGISGESADYLTLDAQGNVYVTGKVRQAEGFDYATIKYDADGQHQWTALFGGDSLGEDAPSDITTDEAGNVCVTGTSEGPDGLFDYATIMYDPDGNELWRNRFDNNLEYWYQRSRLNACPKGGVVVVGGDKWGPQYDDCDFVTIKYFPDGEVAWTNTYSWSQEEWCEFDYANAVIVAEDGNVFVTGASMDIDTYYDFATVKYSLTGEALWTARFSGIAGYDWPTAITLDDLGNIYVTGMMELWFSTVKYGSDGDERWSIVWQGPEGRYDAFVHDIRVDGNDNVYIQGQNNYSGLTTIKYSQAPPTATAPGSNRGLPAGNRLWQNHPNPFNPTTTIEFELSRQTVVSLRVFDVRGRILRTLVEGERAVGHHRVTWDGNDSSGRESPSGLYLFSLIAGASRQTKSMLLLR